MSFETFRDNNEPNDKNGDHPENKAGSQPSSPYSNLYGAPAPQGSTPPPYGAPPQNPSAGLPSAPPVNGYTPEQNSPYSSPYGAPNQAPQANQAGVGNPILFGLTWKKNIVPNPEAKGMTPPQKSVGVAYVLWFFLGAFGVHQFYLGNTGRGLFNLVLWAVTAAVSLVGIPLAIVFTAYWIYEAVTLSDQTKEINSGYIRKSIL